MFFLSSHVLLLELLSELIGIEIQSSFLITSYRSDCSVINWKSRKMWWMVQLRILYSFWPKSVARMLQETDQKQPFGLTWILCQSLGEHSVLVRFTTWNYKLFLLLKENQHSGCLFVELTRIHFVPPFYRYYIYDIYKKNPNSDRNKFWLKNKEVDILLFVLSTFIWNIVVVKHCFHSWPLQPSHFCGVWNFRDWLCG